MTWLTPEQEAAHALESGIARSDLSEKAKLAYDWLVHHPKAQAPPPGSSTDGQPLQADDPTGPSATSSPAPTASTDDKPPQAGPLSPASAASTDDQPLEVDNLAGFDANLPPPSGTINDNQLWGFDEGQVTP
jgi:hypothetical protein